MAQSIAVKGLGMFYKSASLKKMKDRKGQPWRGTLRYRDPDTGLWKQTTKVFRDCKYKADAKVALYAWREEMERKASVRDNTDSVERAIMKYLNEQRSLNKISIVTYQNSLRLARTNIFPALGAKLFIDLTSSDVQDFINDLIRRNYKPSSTRTIFAILSKTCKIAYKRDELISDPTKNVILPRNVKRQINYLGPEARRKFLSLMTEDCNFYLPTMIAYYTGLRAGEICALQWRDINLGANVISITKTAKDYRTESGRHKVEISNPKTPNSVRNVPIIRALKEILLEEARRVDPDSRDYVVSWRNPRLLCTSFYKWSKRNEVIGEADKPITMHGLRHTFATLGVQSGMDIKSLSSILGHANTALTLDVYASDDEQAKQYAMSNLARFFETEGENDL